MATRESDGTIYTHAGPEIGVASTKAFTTQLVALYLLALYIGSCAATLSTRSASRTCDELRSCRTRETLKSQEKKIEEIANALHNAQDFLYLGRAASTTRSRSKAR
jgi:glucosamine--fructose-6-phosphate aminotransferase (isomerizing)